MCASSMASTQTPGRETLEHLFIANLALIERILQTVARRQRLAGDDVEEFCAWATARFVANNYAVLAKFRGSSALATYLTTVAASLLRDYRNEVHGRWRPSAAAQRLGMLGIKLERMTVRDQMPLRQAAELLRTTGTTNLSDRDLSRMCSTFPRRACLRPVEYRSDITSLSRAASIDPHAGDRDEDEALLQRQVMLALSSLQRDELQLIKLVYWDNVSVADASRLLGLAQKPLYRRLERILKVLRQVLERDGMGSWARP